MSSWLVALVTTVIGVLLVGTIIWLFVPVRNMLERRRMTLTGDHGIALIVSSTRQELNGIRPENMLDLNPAWLLGSTFYFASENPPTEPPPVASMEGWEWGRRHGGEDLTFTHVLLRLQATQDRTIVVERPRVTRTVRPITSGIICGPEGVGGNGLDLRRFFIDLDADEPEVEYVDASSDERETAQFSMRKGDTEAFLVTAQALADRHEWYLEIPCLVDGQRVVLTAKNGKRPFVTVGRRGVQAYVWPHDESRWVKMPAPRPAQE